MLHASETWPFTKQNLQRLQRNDRGNDQDRSAMSKPQDTATFRSHELRAQLRPGPHPEGEKTPVVWDTFNDRTEPSSQPMTYRLKESGGLGGPR